MRTSTCKRDAQWSVLASAVSAVLLGGGFTSVYAQDTSEAEDGAIEEVISTGTRIRRDDFTTPNAVTSLTAEEMRDLGLVSVDEMLMEMTSNVAAVSLETNGDSSFFAGETIATFEV